MQKLKKILSYSIGIITLILLTFSNEVISTNINLYNESNIDSMLLEKINPDILKLLNIIPSKQNTTEANKLRSKITGLSLEEIENFRFGKEGFYINNPEIYNIVFSDSRRSYLFNQCDLQNLEGYFNIYSSGVSYLSEGKYNYAVSPNNSNMNCYGYALGKTAYIKPGDIAYGYKHKITNNSGKMVSVETLKNYVLADLRAFGKKPSVVSSSYTANSNEQIIVIRKGIVGSI